MATWKAVSKLLKVPLRDLGGGPRGILIEARRGVWFQASDVAGTLGWTMDDENGKNLGQFLSGIKMEDRSSAYVANLIKHWASEQGVIL